MSYTVVIRSNASKIVALYQRINDTLPDRDKSVKHRQRWSDACSEFHEQYNELAFLGGVDTARDRLRSGDVSAIDYALDFLEIRPYFFRSGYMYNDFMRVLRNCPLSESHFRRYNAIRERYLKYRANRNQNDG